MYLNTSLKQVQWNIPYSQGVYFCVWCVFASTYFDIINALRRGGNWFLVCLSFVIQSEMLSEVTVILVVADRAWDWMFEHRLSETGPLTCLFFPIMCNNHTLTFHVNALQFHISVCAIFCKFVCVCVCVWLPMLLSAASRHSLQVKWKVFLCHKAVSLFPWCYDSFKIP